VTDETLYALRCPHDDGSGSHDAIDLVGVDDDRDGFASMLRLAEESSVAFGCERCGCALRLTGFDD